MAEENLRLREDLRQARLAAMLSREDRAELERLRALLSLPPLRERPGFAARVIAKRFGPQAVLKTFTVDKGYLDGAIVGTPVITENGVVGRILRSAPHASTVLMLTDPGFRLSVITQENRTPGILAGSSGSQRRLEVHYVSQTARIEAGDLLITAGVDGIFPKGIPVGMVTEVTPGNEILFQQVRAYPLVDLESLEEVILLQPGDSGPPLLDPLHDPVEPDPLLPLGLRTPPGGAATGESSGAAQGREKNGMPAEADDDMAP
ncbi:rod shape-determining protein MreC [Desulfovibrio sp. OttesenSCG-928-A18]|nr:rod shape-determining protein MreC [Desulfovibrio sp. OttesenSCG-928-A18]